MKRILGIALCAAMAAGLMTGCEWSTSSDTNESWNDSYNWVNFSGTYRSSSGGMLVTDYTTMSAGGTNNYNISESGGTMANGATTASGTTRHAPIVPGSFSVVVGDVTLSDNGGGVLSGGGGSGTVSYAGGTWSIKLDGGSSSKTANATDSPGYLNAGALSMSGTASHKSIVPSSFKITAGDVTMSDDGTGKLTGTGVKSGSVSYEGGTWNFTLNDKYSSVLPRWVTVEYTYAVSDVSGKRDITIRYAFGASNNGSASGAKAGSSGKPIYSFVVAHQGQNLTITDNNGSVYKGRITKLQSSSGVAPTNSMPRDGDTIIATFSTEGTSAANMQVKIAGTFQGVVSASVFTGRTMQATWIETGGKTGDINGTTVSVAIASPSTTETSSLTITSSTTTTGSGSGSETTTE